MLKRSKSAPLIIEANAGTQFTPEIMDTIRSALQHISRVKELRLVAPKGDIEQSINPIREPAPLLHSLRLSVVNGNRAGSEHTLPGPLFVSEGHHLQRLELVNCIVTLKSPLLRGLVHFKLHETSSRNKIMHLLESLALMPSLETLDVNCPLTVTSGGTDRVVHLPRLTSLRLSSTAPKCTYLLTHMSYPAATSLGLCCERLSASVDYSTLFQAISSVWNGRDGSKLLRTLFFRHILGILRLQGWTNARTDENISENAQIDIELRLEWGYFGPEGTMDMIVALCNAVTLTGLRTLSVDASLLESAWLGAFGHLTSLRTIQIYSQYSLAFLSFFSVGSEGTEVGGDTKGIYFPGLRDLWTKDANFKVFADIYM